MSTNNPELRIYNFFFRYLFDNSIALPYSLSMAEENNEKEKETKIINKSLNVSSFFVYFGSQRKIHFFILLEYVSNTLCMSILDQN